MESEKFEEYIGKIREFLNDGSKVRKVELAIRKEDKDTFSVQYDTEAAGMLLMMIASDEDLADIGMMALAKRFTDAGQEEMEMMLRTFRDMCLDARGYFDASKETGDSIMVRMPSGGLLN